MTGDTPEPMMVPAGLRERVLEASWQARAAGRSVPEVQEISPAEAFSRAADAFYGLLCALADEDWARPVLRDLDVQGLVGHLIGVEEDVHRCLAGDPAVGRGRPRLLHPGRGHPPGRTAARRDPQRVAQRGRPEPGPGRARMATSRPRSRCTACGCP